MVYAADAVLDPGQLPLGLMLRWDDSRRRALPDHPGNGRPVLLDSSERQLRLATARTRSHLFGSDITVPHLDIILPIGISFYHLPTISYIVDSYRGVIKPTRNFSSSPHTFTVLAAGGGPDRAIPPDRKDLENPFMLTARGGYCAASVLHRGPDGEGGDG